jgi:hypothetical protein
MGKEGAALFNKENFSCAGKVVELFRFNDVQGRCVREKN